MENMEQQTTYLPVGWVWTKLGDICEIEMGQSPPSETYNFEGKGLPFFQGKAEFTDLYPTVEKWCSKPQKVAVTNDILLSVRAPVGATNIANQKCCIGRGLAAIRYKQCPKFIFYFLRSIEKALDRKGTGTTFKAVSGYIIKNEKVNLPPLPEQRAIVAKVEQLFSELDNGIASLKKAQEQLKVYRQAVFKWAFEGKLTEKWRKENKDKLKTAEELLEKIKEERRKCYEQELADYKTGKTKTKPKPPKELPPFTEKELAELPQLPEGWEWVRLGYVIEEPKYGTSKKCTYDKKGVGVLRIPNIDSGKIDAADLKFADFDEGEKSIYQLREGDLLTIRSNGSVDLVGKCSLIRKEDEKFLFAGYLIRLRPYKNIIYPKFLLDVLSSYNLRIQIESKVKSTSGVNNINSDEIKSLNVPFCLFEEQHAIVQEIETRLSIADKLEQTITEGLQKADVLRQSILKKAFEGKLLSAKELETVRKDPEWEPAEKLLERIKAEKQHLSKGRKP